MLVLGHGELPEEQAMTTIRTTVIVPEDHKLHLDVELPPESPTGEAEVTLVVRPRVHPDRAKAFAHLREIAARGNLRNGPDPLEWQRDIRKDRPLPGRD